MHHFSVLVPLDEEFEDLREVSLTFLPEQGRHSSVFHPKPKDEQLPAIATATVAI